MSTATLFGVYGAVLVGIGLYGMIAQTELLRRIVAFDVLGSGIFLIFGAVARRGAAGGLASDPIPQAMVITGLVVAFAATGVATALLLRLSASAEGVARRPEGPP